MDRDLTEEEMDRLIAALERIFENQKPLGAEFERVWDENTDRLYEP